MRQQSIKESGQMGQFVETLKFWRLQIKGGKSSSLSSPESFPDLFSSIQSQIVHVDGVLRLDRAQKRLIWTFLTRITSEKN